jgi:adenosylhomocysteine nucleosidase
MAPCAARWTGSGATGMPKRKIVIIAAMEREVAPLIRRWKMRMMEHGGRRYRLFENGQAVLVCGGIGAEAARRATEAVIQKMRPARVVSVGFAGALVSMLKVADVFEPRTVVNFADGSRIETHSGKGTLVSYEAVATRGLKYHLATAYGADAVDMEAAAVAQGALARAVEFGALKAISDAADFAMPPTGRFVSSDGRFRSAAFGAYVAVRPWFWGRTIVLARNSARASRALCAAIEEYCKRETFVGELSQVTDPRGLDMEKDPPKQSLGGAPSHRRG